MKTIQSTPLMIVDQTDSRKLEVYLQSNLPTVQIYNSNSKAFTPNWIEGNGLELKASLFLDSRELEDNATIKWYRNEIKEENELKDAPDDAEDVSTDKKTVIIKTNILEKSAIVTYICQAEYQGITASSRITFARVDTGKDGAKGADGTSVRILGTASAISPIEDTNYWTITYDKGVVEAAAIGDAYVYQGDLYVCAVLNESEENQEDYFINVGNIQGTPAQTITLLGSSQVFRVSQENDTTIITPWAINVIAHLVNIDNDDDIVWQYRYDAKGDWIKIQEKSTDGSIELSGNIAAIVSGDKLPAGVSSVSLKAICEPAKAEDVFTIYKSFDGVDGKHGDSAPIAFLSNEHVSFVADSNGNVNNQTVYTSVIGYDGIVKTKPTIGSLDVANAGLALIGMKVEVDQEATDKLEDEVVLKITVNSKINNNPNNLGSALSNRGDFSIPVTSPAEVALQLNWTKVNTGPEGVGINSVQVEYGVSRDLTQPEGEDNWSPDLPEVPEGSYLWTRTIIDYTDPEKEDTVTYTYAKQGQQGTAGSSVTISSIQYKADASATTAPSTGWSNGVAATSITAPFLWTKTVFSDGNIAYSVARYGTDGAKGDKGDQGIQGIQGPKGDQGVQGPKGNDGQQLYTWIKYADTPTSGMSNDPTGKTYIGLAYNKTTATESNTYSDYMWSLIKGETGPTGPKGDNGQQYYTWIKYADNASGDNMSDSPTGKLYIGLAYNKTTSTESNVATDYIWALFKGDKGDTGAAGADAYTVLLTNESHVFAGSTSAAIASSATTQVLSYKGATSQSATIVSVNGVAASTASTATGIAGLSFKCSALSGTSPTITFTCTTAFVSPNGTIPIVIQVGSISITKMFTYSIAFKGATGGTGPASSSYWLISNASAVQKTANGDVLFTPTTLTFTGKVKTGSGAPTDYAGRWILAYSTDGSTYTNSYTSTANEATASITASDTYKSVRARMYLADGTTTLLDEQIIPFVSDGEVGPIGPTGDDAVTFQIYSSNGYALSTSVPTITLQTFAYIGDVEITAGATFQWYRHNGADWVAISGATNSYLNVSRDDVSFSNNYRCIMQFNNTEYVGVVTIDDKNDENRVFASKPTTYFAGDLWIVGTDYIPSSFTLGTMLRAEHTNSSYADSDWVAATKYDDEIGRLTKTVGEYEQYFSVDSTNGLKVGDASINDNLLKVDRIETTSVNAREIKVESPLTVTGKYSGSTMLQAPILNLGNFSLVIESNGSLSVVANT